MAAALSEQVKAGILASLGAGHTQHLVAAEFGISRSAVARVAALAVAAGHGALNPLSEDWREVQVKKAIAAVNSGLDCVDDSYKRAQIGLQALKGHGIYNSDTNIKLEAHFHSSGAKQVLALDAAMKAESTITDTATNS